MGDIRLNNESKTGLFDGNNSMDVVNLPDKELRLMEDIGLQDESKTCLFNENSSIYAGELHDKNREEVIKSIMEFPRLQEDLELGMDVERFDKSPGQDSDMSNLSYEGSEQSLIEGLGKNTGEHKEEHDKGLEPYFDKEDSDLSMLELVLDEEEVNSSIFDGESQLCIPQDSLFDVFDTYPSLFNNRIPSTENLLSSNVKITDNGTGNGTIIWDNLLNLVDASKDYLDFKVYRKRRSIKRKRRDFGRKSNISSTNISSTKKPTCQRRNDLGQKTNISPMKKPILAQRRNDLGQKTNISPMKKPILAQRRNDFGQKTNISPTKKPILAQRRNDFGQKTNISPTKKPILAQPRNDFGQKTNISPTKKPILAQPRNDFGQKTNISPTKKPILAQRRNDFGQKTNISPTKKPILAQPRNDFGQKTNISSTKKQCRHCKAEKTPQWRMGPEGPKTLCNACGVRFKKGRLVSQYRPLASPDFDPRKHSNRDRKIVRRMIGHMIEVY